MPILLLSLSVTRVGRAALHVRRAILQTRCAAPHVCRTAACLFVIRAVACRLDPVTLSLREVNGPTRLMDSSKSGPIRKPVLFFLATDELRIDSVRDFGAKPTQRLAVSVGPKIEKQHSTPSSASLLHNPLLPPPFTTATMDKLPPPGTAAGGPPSTTFVHADATSFREVVQRLTGPLDEARGGAAVRSPSPLVRTPPPAAAPPGPRVAGLKRPFGLQERRQGPPRPALVIPNPGAVQGLTFTPATSPGMTSPSSLSVAGRWSPLTSPSTNMAKLSIVEAAAAAGQEMLNEAAEERAIKEKRFYLHPSPRSSGQRTAEPELLHLFPTTSPAIGP